VSARDLIVKSEENLPSLNSIEARVARLLAQELDIKQLRVDESARKIDLGFYHEPSQELLAQTEKAVRRQFAGDWQIVAHSDNESPLFHRHAVNDHIAEFHRAHPKHEPQLIWKHIALPKWQNRPVPPSTTRDYRLMLGLAGICGLSALAGFALQRAQFQGGLIAAFFTVAYISGGWFAAQDVWRGLKHRRIDVQFLMIFVALGAAFVRAWTEGATLLFLFSLSNALEQFANHRTNKAIASLLKAAPRRALRRENGAWIEVAIEEVQPDDELLVQAGELFPVDGVIIEGETSADESALTGESLPVAKRLGDSVSSGTLNLDGQAVITTSLVAEESALHRILALIEAAQKQKAPAQRFTDTFSRYYTWAALGASAVLFVVLLSIHKPVDLALYRTMTLLVVASPCALVLSIPSAILVAIAAGARNGILFRGGVAIENLAGVNQFAFDKTGTLTKGALVVTDIAIFDARPEDAVLQIAAAVARFSTHPLARAIVLEAERRALPPLKAADFRNIPGLGMQASVNDENVLIGNRRLLSDRGVTLPNVPPSSTAEVWIATTRPMALIHLTDEIRPAAKSVIDFLKRNRVGVALLTGDRDPAAQAVAAEVGIEDVHAEISPEAKLQCMHHWRQEGKRVAMVGDGINDAPSLTAADVAIGMGARGSDAALEQADVILMHDKIENVEHAFILSRRARSIIRQNIVISLGVVLLLVISALAEKINLTIGVIGHEGSTVVVVLNSLRLLGFAPRALVASRAKTPK
jgi:Cd2+/Zn2+-exporting ATPase